MNNKEISRKEALKRMGLLAVSPSLLPALFKHTTIIKKDGPGWEDLPSIKKNIVPPTFPDRNFSITNFGAKADGKTDSLPAIKKAMSKCNQAGGGKVTIPEGTYFLRGPIHFESNVNLHLNEGAHLKFSTDPDDYLPVVLTRYEGMELMNYSPLVYAYGKENIALTGQGILDGQADNDHWWSWKGSKRFGWKPGMPKQGDKMNEPQLKKMMAKGVPAKKRVFGKGHYMRPTFVEFYRSKNILIKGVTVKNSPFWILHPTLSQNVTIDEVTTISYGPNNDGCDPECCTDVWIKNCHFSNGDDCIAIKSGRNQDGRRIGVPTKNLIVEDCHMQDGHAGVAVGSEMSGGVENIFVQNCEMSSPHLERAIRIKSNACRGGEMKNFHYRNLNVGQVHGAVIRINMHYGSENGMNCHFPPTLKGVYIDNVNSQRSEHAIYIVGRKKKPVHDISIKNCNFRGVDSKNIIEYVKDIHIRNCKMNGKTIRI
ncbi:MAG TPA: glycoside hydrolase family 28 protein [Balneolales bacterium]|nr:glycoside hydrolase family 28 protein [Balneolales bacterium]